MILYITNIYLYCHAKDVTVVSTCYLDKLSGDRKVTACRWRSRVISKNHMLYSREASRHNFWQVSPIITYVFVDVRRFKPYCELVNGELPIKKKINIPLTPGVFRSEKLRSIRASIFTFRCSFWRMTRKRRRKVFRRS